MQLLRPQPVYITYNKYKCVLRIFGPFFPCLCCVLLCLCSMRLLRPQALVQEEAIRYWATTTAYRWGCMTWPWILFVVLCFSVPIFLSCCSRCPSLGFTGGLS